MPVHWFTYVRRFITNLNLFESGCPDIDIVKQERWSTRIYIVLILMALYILAIYKGLGSETSRITVRNPSQELFESLQKKYASTLDCPCSTIAIQYQDFVQIQPKFHQVFEFYAYIRRK